MLADSLRSCSAARRILASKPLLFRQSIRKCAQANRSRSVATAIVALESELITVSNRNSKSGHDKNDIRHLSGCYTRTESHEHLYLCVRACLVGVVLFIATHCLASRALGCACLLARRFFLEFCAAMVGLPDVHSCQFPGYSACDSPHSCCGMR